MAQFFNILVVMFLLVRNEEVGFSSNCELLFVNKFENLGKRGIYIIEVEFGYAGCESANSQD